MEAKKLNLGDMLKNLQSGEIQLPDFQRDWTWDDEKIKSLLESVIRNFPINSIMLLECNSNDTKFSYRKIAGVEKTEREPKYLILDGQQRLTSLFGALFSGEPVKFKKSKKEFFYYVDMKKAVDVVKNSAEVEDLIISVPPSRKLKAKGKNWDLSTPEKEFAASMFPLNKIFKGSRQWLRAYERFHGDDIAVELTDFFDEEVINKISSYEIAIIGLEKTTSLAAVCKIFENANKGVEKLSVFDLLTSIFAAKTDADGKPIELRKDWEEIHKEFDGMNLKILADIECSEYITALTLLVTHKSDKKSASCKEEDILKLNYNDYLRYKGEIIGGFVAAGKFLEEEGITTTKYLP